MTVHRGMPNQSPDRLRVSLDFRYQPATEEIVPESLEIHFGMMNWEEVYRHWHSTRYQYYWRNHDLRLVRFDAETALSEAQ